MADSSLQVAALPESGGDWAEVLSELGGKLGGFGLEIAGVAFSARAVSGVVQQDVEKFRNLEATLERLESLKREVHREVENAGAITGKAGAEIDQSRRTIGQALEAMNRLIDGVDHLEERMSDVQTAIGSIGAITGTIDAIARQSNLLALNATIEAARAGEAGKGFAVVAGEVKQLAGSTSKATAEIAAALESITDGFTRLNEETVETARTAEAVQRQTGSITGLLATVGAAMDAISGSAGRIDASVGQVGAACGEFSGVFEEMSGSLDRSSKTLKEACKQLMEMARGADALVLTVAQNVETCDTGMAALVTEAVRAVEAAFEKGIADGAIARDALFDFSYEPIPGTDPEQYMAPFTEFTDRVLPDIQEGILARSSRIAYCVATDVNCYVATHNREVSHPQGPDPVWNAANCRNRRFFTNDSVWRAVRNEEPLLLQTYRRDMGGGEFVLMKEISSPVRVGGRKWGIVRMGYQP